MPSPSIDISTMIKSQALSLGFDACGFAAATPVDEEAVARYDRWIELGHNGCMAWAAGHRDLRRDPSMLLEGAQTVISLALNYYPARFQPSEAMRVAYYAYGRDYHEVLREKLTELAHFIEEITHCTTRPCVDSAPIRERYWAQRAGIGFIGRNNCLILPGKGSYFFLGEIVTTAQLPPDEPCRMTCGDCGRCIEACPSGALKGNGAADCNRCLSCLLIENHTDELPEWMNEVEHEEADDGLNSIDEILLETASCQYAHSVVNGDAVYGVFEYRQCLSGCVFSGFVHLLHHRIQHLLSAYVTYDGFSGFQLGG